MTRRLASPINRRAFLGVTPGAFASLLDAKLLRAGDPPLKITKVEAIVIRTPKDERAHEDFVEMPPLGSLTGGPGLWNRLDHASPSRMKGATQATLVKITTDRGLRRLRREPCSGRPARSPIGTARCAGGERASTDPVCASQAPRRPADAGAQQAYRAIEGCTYRRPGPTTSFLSGRSAKATTKRTGGSTPRKGDRRSQAKRPRAMPEPPRREAKFSGGATGHRTYQTA